MIRLTSQSPCEFEVVKNADSSQTEILTFSAFVEK